LSLVIYKKLETLEHIDRIKELEKQLSNVVEASIEAMREKDIFLSTISHEVRTPLNAIVGISHLLSQDSHFSGDERIKILKFSSESLLNLFTDLLEISKIESGKLQLNITNFHLYELISNIFASIEFLAAQKGLAFDFQFDSRIFPYVSGDSVRLNQVLNNLLSNAIKFTNEGSILLSIELWKDGPNYQIIRFRIQDTGIGIDEELQKKVFDYFYQGYRTAALSGAGLGLSISQSLLKLMDSKIKLSSRPSFGSEFSFDLKMNKVQINSETNFQKEKNLHGCKILVAEDHKASQFIIKGFLSKWKAHVTLADNGARAVELARADKYDLILMDLHMPVMDGYQATAAIRAISDGHYDKVPIVSLTALTVSEIKEKIFLHGFTDVLPKPFQPEELYKTLTRHLQNRDSPRIQKKIESIDFVTLRNYILSFFSSSKRLVEFCEQFSKDLEFIRANYPKTILDTDIEALVGYIRQLLPVLKWLEIKPLYDELMRGKILLESSIVGEALSDNIQKVVLYCEQLINFFNNEFEHINKREIKITHPTFTGNSHWG
jgi:CheY-like chemotaxis protein/nitrogen-specific signal transduction histidine kinase